MIKTVFVIKNNYGEYLHKISTDLTWVCDFREVKEIAEDNFNLAWIDDKEDALAFLDKKLAGRIAKLVEGKVFKLKLKPRLEPGFYWVKYKMELKNLTSDPFIAELDYAGNEYYPWSSSDGETWRFADLEVGPKVEPPEDF